MDPAKKSENGSRGLRLLARKFAAEAIDISVGIMRNSKDDRARARACAVILNAALCQPVQETLDD